MKQRSRKSTAPQKIGKYPVLGEIGHGELGGRLLADDPFNERKVAIKVADVRGARRRSGKGRNYSSTKRRSPVGCNIPISSPPAVVEGAQRHIVMEYVPGGSLRQLVMKEIAGAADCDEMFAPPH
jgi:hypothetical protein